MKDKQVFKKSVTSGLFQLGFFTLIPFIAYLISQRRILGFFESLGFYLPDKIVSFLVVYLVLFVTSRFFKLTRKIFLEEAPSSLEDKLPLIQDAIKAGKSPYTIGAVLFLGLITTGLSEEILFRGFLTKALISGLGFGIGNMLQATVFSLLHAVPLYMQKGSLSDSIHEFVRVFSIAFLMGYCLVYLASGSLLPLWVYHGLGNAIAFYKSAFKDLELAI